MELYDNLPEASDSELTDVHSASQLQGADLDRLFVLTDRMRSLVERDGGTDLLEHRQLATVFYEPSTRTASSFVAAMQRLGGDVIPLFPGAEDTSAKKGESLRDTVRTLSQYADAIVLRHPDPGSAPEAADAATVPLVNAGDGSREHPTQALLDVFTMTDKLGALDGKTVALAGDLKFGRTVHSLAGLLGLFDVDVQLISPPALALGDEYLGPLRDSGVPVETHDTLEPALRAADVLYMTRIQRERFDDPAEYERHAGTYEITPDTMNRMADHAILMHPLPRVGEIDPDCDADPRAVYFEQARNGMYLRMALLADLLRP